MSGELQAQWTHLVGRPFLIRRDLRAVVLLIFLVIVIIARLLFFFLFARLSVRLRPGLDARRGGCARLRRCGRAGRTAGEQLTQVLQLAIKLESGVVICGLELLALGLFGETKVSGGPEG